MTTVVYHSRLTVLSHVLNSVGTLNAIFDHKEPMSFSDLEHSPFDWEFYKTAINTVRARQKYV